MIKPGDVISYWDMCAAESASLQRGMNFHLHKNYSVILMSLRPNAPYADKVEEGGRILIYEGHDLPNTEKHERKTADQPESIDGKLTQNGLFYKAAVAHKEGKVLAEKVKVYEKIRSGIWVYNGVFDLIDAWTENSNERKVFKFKLEITEESLETPSRPKELEHARIIPSNVKLAVWKRDGGKCIQCGSTDNLHFDHIIPYSKGGTSLKVENIQLLCARHNLQKRAKIE